MSSRSLVIARLRGVRFGRCEEVLLLGVILIGATYPFLREFAHSVAPILCGLPATAGNAIGHQALIGKIGCALALALGLPLGARRLAGSWVALTRTSAYRVALGVAGIATATLTAYDACTGFHATQPMAEGCACWLTALVAGIAAFVTVALILGGRAIVGALHEALAAILGTFVRLREQAAQTFAKRDVRVCTVAGALLARHCAGRGPPLPRLHFV